MGNTTWGGLAYPEETDDFDAPVDILDLANTIRTGAVPQFTTTSARNNAAATLPALHRAVCYVENVGHCGWNGSEWVNLTPPKRYLVDRSYGTGAVAQPGAVFQDSVPLTIPGLINGQYIEAVVQADIRVDGGSRQTVGLTIAAVNALQSTQSGKAEMRPAQAIDGTGGEFFHQVNHATFFANTGTVNLLVYLACGAGPDRLVMNQAQIFATVYPLNAA